MHVSPVVRPSGLGALRLLLFLAMVATLVASGVMAVFLVDAPESGTRAFDVMSAAAAICGVAATVLFALAAVWSVVRGLWRYLRRPWRVAVYATVIVALAIAGVSSTSAT